MLTRLRLLVAALWAGSLWTVGYLVAPILSNTLPDRKMFGNIAAGIFRGEAWLTVACALAMFVLVMLATDLDARRKRTLNLIVGGMLACTVIGYFGMQPVMAMLRESAGAQGVMDSDLRMKFGIVHGVAALIYLVQSVLGVTLVLKSKT
ncbi:DUF4149 domain-containing protein [Massilia soli]|uniref:DUF4149 domain-containing protein n=1 Tax=Massilia soli TaxID=2792854 RepID=A0ABS7SME3_9BURK|nr:DUF4149 domain-containing protein [Massilia soli]MBZ2207284.1 DUF4149 domain-containing protein [Massilia soli]